MYSRQISAVLCLLLRSCIALPTSDTYDDGSSAAAASSISAASPYPFKRMVAFGDNLSDNGNGSYAHCVANPKNCKDKIYGYGTWTNGPVAVSYLSTNLGVPLSADYAFGGSNGGSQIGATINNSYTASPAAPDAFDQVNSYLSANDTQANIGNTLHFIWIGNNDISLSHINVAQKKNANFANQMASQMATLVQRLVDAGAKSLFVVGMYPKQVSPQAKYLTSTQVGLTNLANAITDANTAIQQKLLQQFGSKVQFYDVFSYMANVYNNHDDYGIKYILPDFCDGYSAKDWNLCVIQNMGDQFYWMQATDMTTRVHSLVATDMAQAINANNQ